MEDEYPSNSKLVKRNIAGAPQAEVSPEKKVQRVTTGEVRRQQKGLLRKAKEAFVGDDTKGVMEYVFVDILVPGLKTMVEQSITQGVSRKLWGGAIPMGGAGPLFRPQQPWVNYQQPSTLRQPAPQQPGLSKQARATHRFDEIVFGARIDADSVLQQLRALVGEFGMASVRDFYDSVGEESEYTDGGYGWRDLAGAHVQPARGGGYQIILPRPEPLN